MAALAQDGSGVSVQLSGGGGDAERVVLAVPLTLQRELRFEPPLPPPAARWQRRATGTRARTPRSSRARLRACRKVLTEDGFYYSSTDDPRVLVRFAGAAAAAREIDFADVTGVAPRAVAGVRWSEEPWTHAGRIILGPGHLTTWGGRLGEPHGRIHFAGAEASTLPSYMEGAAGAGERRRGDPRPHRQFRWHGIRAPLATKVELPSRHGDQGSDTVGAGGDRRGADGPATRGELRFTTISFSVTRRARSSSASRTRTTGEVAAGR